MFVQDSNPADPRQHWQCIQYFDRPEGVGFAMITADGLALSMTPGVQNPALRPFALDPSYIWQLARGISPIRDSRYCLTMHGSGTGNNPWPSGTIIDAYRWQGNYENQYWAINTVATGLVLDVWGEGRVVTTDSPPVKTGFTAAYNLNIKNGKITNGPDKGQPIPFLVPVDDWDNPAFPIASGMISIVTLMGSPFILPTAKEMARVLRLDGMIIVYGLDADEIKTFESNLSSANPFIKYRPNVPLSPPFDSGSISLQPARVYQYVIPGNELRG